MNIEHWAGREHKHRAGREHKHTAGRENKHTADREHKHIAGRKHKLQTPETERQILSTSGIYIFPIVYSFNDWLID